MSIVSQQAKSIRELVRINFERMVSFDKASRVTKDSDLRVYFEEKAEESERNIDELQQINIPEHDNLGDIAGLAHLPACRILDRALTENKIENIIQSARRVEKHMMEWYQKIVEGLTNVPGDWQNIVKSQLATIRNGQLMLQQLIAV